MSKKIVAGNWKMNMNRKEALALLDDLKKFEMPKGVDVVIFPPNLFISELSENSTHSIRVGSQNFHAEQAGAFTGEVSIPQLKSVGSNVGLIGHSERRSMFGESNSLLKAKVDSAVKQQFEFIFCCGESLDIRESGNESQYVLSQLEESLFHLSAEEMRNKVVAYEPVWAIGTGRTATVEQAEAMHAVIRESIGAKYGMEIADSVSILHGGSCNAENAGALFACPNVDGGLIGGASLKVESFLAIINSF